MRSPLLSLAPRRLAELLEGTGRARMVFSRLAQGVDPFKDPSLSQKVRKKLLETVHPPDFRETDRRSARDGTIKMLLHFTRGYAVECVLIPNPSRTTLCLSTQVGCARGCRFCLTATMGLQAQLPIEHIIAQVYHGLQVVHEEGLPNLRNLVFMGMGEPLDNWTAVHSSLITLTDGRGFGFGPKHITVSTVAPSPKAVGLLDQCSTRVAWSLHAARDDVRRALVPTQQHSVIELLGAFRSLFQHRKDPIFVEMALIEGFNDQPDDAEAAALLLRDFPTEVRFNLLPLNPTQRGLARASETKVQNFAQHLQQAGYFTKVRTARGQDEQAACGQLATSRLPTKRGII
ncbi:MAG: radical SAM protein [Myxococcales bacterium]|nr:radical SAM protein [Myxococcales bacterium]